MQGDVMEGGNVDTQEYRQTMGRFATGVTVVTAGQGDATHAMTANAIASLSLDPVLLIFCVKKEAHMAAALVRAGGFTVNILGAGQDALSDYFSGFWSADEPPPFGFTPWGSGARLAGCIAALRCAVHARHDGGDHWIVVGRVIDLYRSEENEAPLIYFQGRYVSLV